jgi:hypothetical protein
MIYCESVQCILKQLKQPNNQTVVDYPVNTARNIARHYVTTEYELVGDIELIPATRYFVDKMHRFLHEFPLSAGRPEVNACSIFKCLKTVLCALCHGRAGFNLFLYLPMLLILCLSLQVLSPLNYTPPRKNEHTVRI